MRKEISSYFSESEFIIETLLYDVYEGNMQMILKQMISISYKEKERNVCIFINEDSI